MAAKSAAKSLQSCPTVRPQRRQPTRLPCPRDSPGRNTGVGCHFLLQCMKVKSKSEVAQSCPTLSNPMGCSPPGSSIHGIFQARVLEWGVIAFSDTYMEDHTIRMHDSESWKQFRWSSTDEEYTKCGPYLRWNAGHTQKSGSLQMFWKHALSYMSQTHKSKSRHTRHEE